MKHNDCKNYINLDCEKGVCALTKTLVMLEGEGSATCPRFEQAPKCGNCKNFVQDGEYNIGTCSGFEKSAWAYSTCDAYTCEKYAG